LPASQRRRYEQPADLVKGEDRQGFEDSSGRQMRQGGNGWNLVVFDSPFRRQPARDTGTPTKWLLSAQFSRWASSRSMSPLPARASLQAAP
jgi:hypothetical protein